MQTIMLNSSEFKKPEDETEHFNDSYVRVYVCDFTGTVIPH